MSKYIMSADELISNAESGFKTTISDGIYSGVVVGYSVHENQFKDKETGEDVTSIGAKLIIQVTGDDGKPTVVTTSPLKASLHEKAGLRAIMASWLKKSDPKSIVDAMVEAGIVKDGVFAWSGFLGRKPSVMIKMVAGKSDATKLYPQISSIVPCKVGQAIDPTPMELPAYIFKDSLENELLTGFSIKSASSKKEAVKKISQAPQVNILSEPADIPF